MRVGKRDRTHTSLARSIVQPGCFLPDDIFYLGNASVSSAGWAGFVINGYVRDTMEMKDVNIGMHAIGAFPRKPGKKLPGQTGLTLNFGGVTISPGDWVYADEDGILISRKQLQWPKVA